MSDQERCPKCGGLVYAEHKEHWCIRCCQCDLHTDNFDSHSEARRAWDNMQWVDYHGNEVQKV